jgi:hypothetical protein
MSACAKLPRFPGVKDPDDRVNLTFKGGRLPVGVTVASVTVTDVDVADVAVPVSDLTLGAVALAVNDAGLWTAVCSVDGGVANPVVTTGVIPEPRPYLLRSRWFLSNGTHRDRTVLLYVGNN